MSAESGVPTYRGRGGIWNQYKWENYACQTAFERDPEGVLEFHELRRIEALKCQPHRGHTIITHVQNDNSDTIVITQNIDGMHQRSKSKNVIELHGSLWRMRCESEKILKEDLDQGKYHTRKCDCGNWLRPDIIWFQDMLNDKIVLEATQAIAACDLFISIGTSAVVWPAAGYPKLAKTSGAFCVEINPEETELTTLYDQTIRMPASAGLEHLFK
jgi:NAD-dependent deacetylase